MWWLVAAGLAVIGVVLWEVVATWWEVRGWSATGHPLLVVLLRDGAEAVEGVLRHLLHLLGWGTGPGGWEVVVLDVGSQDDTPLIACRLLSRAGIPFLRAGPEWWWLVREAADRGRPVLLFPLGQGDDFRPWLTLLGGVLGGKSRILSPRGELHHKCNAGS